jgi:hypothetical protein
MSSNNGSRSAMRNVSESHMDSGLKLRPHSL